MKTKENKNSANKPRKKDLPGYPIYPSSEDIYSRNKEESDLDPEDPTHLKTPVENLGILNEKNFKNDMTGGDLDIPGSEIDDEREATGNEDEENNLYSLGGDKD